MYLKPVTIQVSTTPDSEVTVYNIIHFIPKLCLGVQADEVAGDAYKVFHTLHN